MPKKKTTKKKVKPLTWDDVSKWPPVENLLLPALYNRGLTPEQFAEDKELTLGVCRKEIEKKRKPKHIFVAMREMRQEYDQVMVVAGWKAPEKKQLSGTVTLEQAVKELEKEDG